MSMSLMQFYDLVKNIPYRPDPPGNEYLQRPYYTLTQTGGGGDCDDKSIVLGAYLANARIPFRFVAVGAQERLHHVITEAFVDGKWLHLDPTYSYNTFGQPLYRYKKRLLIG